MVMIFNFDKTFIDLRRESFISRLSYKIQFISSNKK